jgi:preprotein translocase subunit YajC
MQAASVLGTSVGQQVAFVICVIVPVSLIAVPLFLANRRQRKAKAAELRTDA